MFETLVTLFVFLVGGALATYFVSRYVHAPLKAASAGEEDFTLDHEFTYLDELEELERRPLDKAELIALGKRYAIDDHTPCGRIAMTYAHEDSRFEYWSERNHIPYKTLDAVARRFCVENDCKALYVDMYQVLYQQWAGSFPSPCSSGGGGSGGSGSSEDDYTHLFGQCADDSDTLRRPPPEGARSDDLQSSHSDSDDDDECNEADSLLASFVRSPGQGLEEEEQEEEKEDKEKEDASEVSSCETKGGQKTATIRSSVFASFKEYNAPANAISTKGQKDQRLLEPSKKVDGEETETAISKAPGRKDNDDLAAEQNTFLRRGSMYDWEAMCRAPRHTKEEKEEKKESCGEIIARAMRPLSYAAFKAAQMKASDKAAGTSVEMQPLLSKAQEADDGVDKGPSAHEEVASAVKTEDEEPKEVSALFDRLF